MTHKAHTALPGAPLPLLLPLRTNTPCRKQEALLPQLLLLLLQLLLLLLLRIILGCARCPGSCGPGLALRHRSHTPLPSRVHGEQGGTGMC